MTTGFFFEDAVYLLSLFYHRSVCIETDYYEIMYVVDCFGMFLLLTGGGFHNEEGIGEKSETV